MRIKLNILIVLILSIATINKIAAQTRSKTARQLELLNKEKKSRNAVEQKIDSRLLQAIREKQGKKMAQGTELEPVNVNVDTKGNLEVDIKADVTDALLKKIVETGGRIIFPSKQYHTIRASINLLMAERIASFKEVKFIAPGSMPQLNRGTTTGAGSNLPGTDVPAKSPSSAKGKG
jgi:hypothetical protein